MADAAFAGDLAEVLERAREAGVATVLCVSEGLPDADRVLQLCAQHLALRPCIGLHPEQADIEAADAICGRIEANLDRLAGIGEVGLDYWLAKEEPEREVQRAVLGRFAALSVLHDLALNVHSRSAGHHTIEFLAEQGVTRALMHAFDGRAHYALAGVEAGFRFSIPPSIVRSRQKQKLVERLPLEALLLETDSPVLGPTREMRNEPCNVQVSAEAIAEIKSCRVEEVVEVTTENARALFRLDG